MVVNGVAFLNVDDHIDLINKVNTLICCFHVFGKGVHLSTHLMWKVVFLCFR